MTLRCKVCDEPTHDDGGSPIGTVLCYQKVNGKIQLARELVLHAPMFYIHEFCLEALDDRQS